MDLKGERRKPSGSPKCKEVRKRGDEVDVVSGWLSVGAISYLFRVRGSVPETFKIDTIRNIIYYVLGLNH